MVHLGNNENHKQTNKGIPSPRIEPAPALTQEYSSEGIGKRSPFRWATVRFPCLRETLGDKSQRVTRPTCLASFQITENFVWNGLFLLGNPTPKRRPLRISRSPIIRSLPGANCCDSRTLNYWTETSRCTKCTRAVQRGTASWGSTITPGTSSALLWPASYRNPEPGSRRPLGKSTIAT